MSLALRAVENTKYKYHHHVKKLGATYQSSIHTGNYNASASTVLRRMLLKNMSHAVWYL